MKPLMKRDDIQPVILGGDWSTYSLARQFLEAFGVHSYFIANSGIALVESSNFIVRETVESMCNEEVLRAIKAIADRHPQKKVVLVANSDDRVETVECIAEDLPDNVVYLFPPHEVSSYVSDKVNFMELCQKYGLDTSRTEVVHLAQEGPIAPTEIPFPVVAKPASSTEYVNLHAKGFKKVYFVHDQAELDQIWSDLRGVGYKGDFLVQELIEGDDTLVDCITMYVDSRGELGLRAAANVLLEDHAPTLLGNPVSMIVNPMPELWQKIEVMLKEIGWRGFANFDLKRDPKDGRVIFMDFNPRVGASSYYACAGGANPMYTLVRDIVDGVQGECATAEREMLYTRVPVKLLRHYLRDPQLLDRFDRIVSEGRVVNPCRCKDDGLKARMYGLLMEQNYVRKFKTFYPDPTDTSF